MSLCRLAAVLAVLLAFAGCRDRDREPAHPVAHDSGFPSDHLAMPSPTAPANPVQAEMRTLTEILELTIRSIGTRDVRPIEHELHRLHAAKEATIAAVRRGTYTLPKNRDNVAGFAAMDDAFHADLEELAAASRANDVQAAAEALASLMRGCEGCHAAFRP